MAKIAEEFQECLSKGKITVFADGEKLVKKQLKISSDDLSEAKTGITNQRWKWSTIQAYCSMFHAARALLYAKGFRERHHRCLRIAISHLYSSEGDEFTKLVEVFQLAKQMRENADYDNTFSENGATKLVDAAEKFLKLAKKILKD